MSAIEARGARAGARRLARVLTGIEAAVRDEVPVDVVIVREPGAIVLVGRSLRARAARDARLRGLGLLAKGQAR